MKGKIHANINGFESGEIDLLSAYRWAYELRALGNVCVWVEVVEAA